MKAGIRSSAIITYTTWKALFLRAAVNSLSASRMAWFWMLAEPIAFIIVMMLFFTIIRVRTIGGINTAVWVMAGMLAFLMFRRVAMQTMNAVRENKNLYNLPQIRPFDTVLIRAALEGFLMTIITITLLAGAALYGLDVVPVDPLAVLEAFFGLWLLGIGVGLIGSVAIALAPPVGTAINFIMSRPLFILSGVLFPVGLVPYPYQSWLMLNPVAHGLEAARLGFAPYYHVAAAMSVGFIFVCALVTIFFGMSLHFKYAKRLAAIK